MSNLMNIILSLIKQMRSWVIRSSITQKGGNDQYLWEAPIFPLYLPCNNVTHSKDVSAFSNYVRRISQVGEIIARSAELFICVAAVLISANNKGRVLRAIFTVPYMQRHLRALVYSS